MAKRDKENSEMKKEDKIQLLKFDLQEAVEGKRWKLQILSNFFLGICAILLAFLSILDVLELKIIAITIIVIFIIVMAPITNHVKNKAQRNVEKIHKKIEKQFIQKS